MCVGVCGVCVGVYGFVVCVFVLEFVCMCVVCLFVLVGVCVCVCVWWSAAGRVLSTIYEDKEGQCVR